MPEDIEIETNELHEKVQELHERATHGEEGPSLTRWISLSTAIFAVFAAVGALRSGDLSNEALTLQLKASDTWNEYQSAKEKVHIYTVGLDQLVVIPAQSKLIVSKEADFNSQLTKESAKLPKLQSDAEKMQKDSAEMLDKHKIFAYEVALLQVSIAMSAIAALTKNRTMWATSLIVGAIGVVLFALGFAR